MQERRITQRQRNLKSGSVLLDRDRAYTCMVRNISDAGACLEFAIPLDIPDDFTLSIPRDHFRRPCHVVWRREKRIGVAFG